MVLRAGSRLHVSKEGSRLLRRQAFFQKRQVDLLLLGEVLADQRVEAIEHPA
jgi:hypothetical protein